VILKVAVVTQIYLDAVNDPMSYPLFRGRAANPLCGMSQWLNALAGSYVETQPRLEQDLWRYDMY